MEDLFEYLRGCLPAIIISVFGGFVATITGDKKLTIRFFFGGLLASALVGFIANAALLKIGADQNVWAITLSITGYCSGSVLEIVKKKFLDRIRAEADKI